MANWTILFFTSDQCESHFFITYTYLKAKNPWASEGFFVSFRRIYKIYIFPFILNLWYNIWRRFLGEVTK